jgi:hypothetical protein
VALALEFVGCLTSDSHIIWVVPQPESRAVLDGIYIASTWDLSGLVGWLAKHCGVSGV